jgi:hypothetical protein
VPVHDHLVQFYESDGELADSVASYLAEGLRTGEVGITIATERHRRAIAREAARHGVDLKAAAADGTYVSLDAADTLARFTRDGSLDAGLFDEVIGGLIREHRHSGRSVRAFGEMVDLLWRRGDTSGAIELEKLWNQLNDREGFRLLCAYRAPASVDRLKAIRNLCRVHDGVLPSAAAEALPIPAALTAKFQPSKDAPQQARARVRALVEKLQLAEDSIERAVLVASELTTNAVLHSVTPFRLVVQPKGATLWIGVEDAQPLEDGRTVVARAPHGLGIVAALALRWGISRRESGKLVWAELPA